MESSLRKMRLIILFTAASLIFMTGFTFGIVEDNITKSFKVGQGGKLTLKTDIGSIEVQGVEGNSLEVEVLRRVEKTSKKKAEEILKDFDIKFSQSGNDVYIEAKYEKDGWSRFWDKIRRRLRVKFIVSVPRVYNIELKTRGGGISVEDLDGEVNCKTSGGGLNFDNITGPIWGRTSGGGIQVGEVNGNVDVHTSGGGIRITNAKGKVLAHTSGGGITVNEVMGAIQADTSGGSIKAYISRQPKSNCHLKTSGGSVTVYLEEDIGVFVDARTSGGRIKTEFPVTLRGEISKKALKAKINEGGPELYLRTSGGSIYIRKK